MGGVGHLIMDSKSCLRSTKPYMDKILDDYYAKYGGVTAWKSPSVPVSNASDIGIDTYSSKISELERKIEELQAFIEAISRENLACNVEELL